MPFRSRKLLGKITFLAYFPPFPQGFLSAFYILNPMQITKTSPKGIGTICTPSQSLTESNITPAVRNSSTPSTAHKKKCIYIYNQYLHHGGNNCKVPPRNEKRLNLHRRQSKTRSGGAYWYLISNSGPGGEWKTGDINAGGFEGFQLLRHTSSLFLELVYGYRRTLKQNELS